MTDTMTADRIEAAEFDALDREPRKDRLALLAWLQHMIERIDTKALGVLTVDGVLFSALAAGMITVVTGVTTAIPRWAGLPLLVPLVLVLVSMGFAVLAMVPKGKGPRRSSPFRHLKRPIAQILADFPTGRERAEREAEQIQFLTGLLAWKTREIQIAIVLFVGTLVASTLAAAVLVVAS